MIEKHYIATLESKNAELEQEVKLLREKVEMLLELLEKKGITKDSHNSHLPPSSDVGKKNKRRSLRKPSENKSGGQPGHEGKTLKFKDVADQVFDLKSDYCSHCGESLEAAEYVLQARRQVVQLPKVEALTQEYRQWGCRCSRCEHFQVADFPADVKAPIQYGGSVEAMVGYLSVYQYLPYRRLKQMLGDVFNLPVSEGSIENMLERGSAKAGFVHRAIKAEIAAGKVVGSDETSAKVNGEKWWIWVWQNVRNTYLKATDNRGSKTVDEVWSDGLPTATVVSDRWAAQLKMASGGNQLCLAHLMRDAIYLREKENHPVGEKFEKFFGEVFRKKRESLERGQAYSRESPPAKELEKTLNELLGQTVDEEKYKETARFQRAMIKHRNSLLRCLYELETPADNNASERAIRNVKVKEKISGQFKSGQQSFCVWRSVIDTLIKRHLDVLTHLTQIMNIQPE